MAQYSAVYVQHLRKGAFPGQIDPWAEAGRYFQQLHSEIISHLLGQIQEPLLAMGYIAGRETSLQIAENRQPDIYIQRQESPSPESPWNYAQAAEAVQAKPGLLLENTEPDMDALHIRDRESGNLVTVVEIISPRNKTEMLVIQDYQERRARLLHKGVNVVEMDFTRSVKRLIQDVLAGKYAYHVAIHLHNQASRLIGMDFGQVLIRCALPLRENVIPVELQAAYDHAYQLTSLAGHIQAETGYGENALPFSSLLTADQRHHVLERVQQWQAELQRLRDS